MNRATRAGGIGLLFAMLASPALAESSDPPPVGYRPAPDSTEGGLWQTMDNVEADIRSSPLLVKDEALNAYVKKLVCDLAGPQCPSLRVYVVDDADNNAMTAPNGMVIVWTGLLLRAQSEAELAFVLSHEITHYLKRHSLKNFESTRDTAGAVAVVSILAAPFTMGGGGLLAGLVAAGAISSYTRDQEREADAGGIELMMSRGYDPRQGTLFMAKTAEEEDANPNRDRPMAYFASHPATKDRIADLQKQADKEAAGKSDLRSGEDAYRSVMLPHRAAWLEAELNRGEYGESLVVIGRLLKTEPQSAELNYFLGEAYRRRNLKGDLEKAVAAYRTASDSAGAPAALYRGLGLSEIKLGDKMAAREALMKYLTESPDADDKATVEYYLTRLGGEP